jgi:hypothetical protein
MLIEIASPRLVTHRQDRASVRLEERSQGGWQRLCRICTTDDVAFRVERALDGAAEDQRLDLIVEDPVRRSSATGKARGHL